MTPASTIALAFIVAVPLILFVAKRWGQQVSINATAAVCLVMLAAVLLTGCGESVSEYHQNEKRDERLRDAGKDISSVDQRLQELEARVSVLEERAGQKP